MNEIANKFLLAGDKLMPEMHLRQPAVPVSLGKLDKSGFTEHLLKAKKELRKLKKQEIQDIFIKTN